MIKVLHAADFHLDAAFSALPPELAVRRRAEQRMVLERLAQEAQACDIVLLAGDLFDSARIYRDSLEALRRFFEACDAEIFIAAGNHDYLTPGSPYLTEDWGERVHIFRTASIECVHLDHLHCDVYGASFTAPEMPALLDGFQVSNPDVTNLMVLHGDVLNPASPYHPIAPEAVSASGLDYLALGHIHKAEIHEFGATVCAWPGCLMGRGFDECGQKGVLLAEIASSGCRVHFLPVASRRYEILSVEAGDDPLAAVRSALPDNTRDDCYRIILTGEAETFDTAVLEAALAPEFFSLSVRDNTYPKQSLWDACGEDTLRGHFLENLKVQYDAADETQRRILAQAAKLGLALLDGREVLV